MKIDGCSAKHDSELKKKTGNLDITKPVTAPKNMMTLDEQAGDLLF